MHPVREAGIQLDQVVIGSCTNGRLEDLQVAATLLKGRQVHPRCGCWLYRPPSRFTGALKQGLLEIFVEAGGGGVHAYLRAAWGAYGDPGPGGALATTNRNFVGRMGHPESEFICGPAVAAASAVAGTIVDPRCWA